MEINIKLVDQIDPETGADVVGCYVSHDEIATHDIDGNELMATPAMRAAMHLINAFKTGSTLLSSSEGAADGTPT